MPDHHRQRRGLERAAAISCPPTSPALEHIGGGSIVSPVTLGASAVAILVRRPMPGPCAYVVTVPSPYRLRPSELRAWGGVYLYVCD